MLGRCRLGLTEYLVRRHTETVFTQSILHTLHELPGYRTTKSRPGTLHAGQGCPSNHRGLSSSDHVRRQVASACRRPPNVVLVLTEVLGEPRRHLSAAIFTVRRSYASAVLGVVILSVRLSVCHTRAL